METILIRYTAIDEMWLINVMNGQMIEHTKYKIKMWVSLGMLLIADKILSSP